MSALSKICEDSKKALDRDCFGSWISRFVGIVAAGISTLVLCQIMYLRYISVIVLCRIEVSTLIVNLALCASFRLFLFAIFHDFFFKYSTFMT